MDIHVLQTVPPSCVNRDDTGSPKTAVYGGVTRARVSSQAWKKAVRDSFKSNQVFPDEAMAIRTKRLPQWIHEEMQVYQRDISMDVAVKLLNAVHVKIEKVKKTGEYQAKALFFMSKAQAKALARITVDNAEIINLAGSLAAKDNSEADDSADEKKDKSKEKAKKITTEQKKQFDKVIEQAIDALKGNPSIEIALFGRMVADDPSLNTDACAQVAHAISTHKVSNEYDYFTAVDDMSPEDNAGAAHIDTVEFNSSTLYRYATVAVHALHQQLEEDTLAAVKGFVRAFVCSMPTGKQNTFANRTLPDALLVTVRQDQPVNLVGAFEKPVFAGEEGYVALSAKRLSEHANKVYQDFAGKPAYSFVVGDALGELGERSSFDALLRNLDAVLVPVLEGLNGADA